MMKLAILRGSPCRNFPEYLGLEDMGVFTAYGMKNGSASKVKELRDFGRTLK